MNFGRRFYLVVGCALTYTGLLIGGFLDSGAYVALQTLTIGAYLAANTHQKNSECKYGPRNPS